MIGCALTHLTLWSELADKPLYHNLLVLEDDAILATSFSKKVQAIVVEMDKSNTNWDVIFLGFIPINNKIEMMENNFRIEKWTTMQASVNSLGGTHGYIINPRGANRLLQFIQENGMTNAIDTMIHKACDLTNIYFCVTQLVSGNVVGTDTNIQRDYLSLKKPILHRLQEDLTYYHHHGIPTLVSYEIINNKFGSEIVYCLDGNCSHPIEEFLTYSIGITKVHIPFQITEKYPFTKNIGLMKDGKWSTENLINP